MNDKVKDTGSEPNSNPDDDDFDWLTEAPPRPLNFSATVAEALDLIESWDEHTSLARKETDLAIIALFLSRFTVPEHKAAA